MGNSLFKNAIKPSVGNSFQTLYSAPAGQASLLLQLNGSVVGAAALVGSARIFDASDSTYSYLMKKAPIPTGDAIRLIDQAKVVLEAGDRIEIMCESPSETIDFIGSLIEDINDNSFGKFLGSYKNAIKPDVGNSWTTLYQAPANKTTFVLQINAANKSESGVQVSVRLWDDSAGLYASVLDSAPVPVADAIRLIDHAKIVLEENDRLEVKCNTLGEAVDLVGSLIEDVNQI